MSKSILLLVLKFILYSVLYFHTCCRTPGKVWGEPAKPPTQALACIRRGCIAAECMHEFKQGSDCVTPKFSELFFPCPELIEFMNSSPHRRQNISLRACHGSKRVKVIQSNP